MDQLFQALVMGIVQGLTEFLPISSSGHLVLVPYVMGWQDPFITSLAFSVLLNIGTLAALLIYFGSDWLRLVPAGLAAIRDRSFRDSQERRLAWLLVATTIPAALVGYLFNDVIDEQFHGTGPETARLVAAMLVVGAAIMWAADRWGGQERRIRHITFPMAFGIGVAQALALIPGISRSGVSIAAGRAIGLNRESAARFSFLMAAPIILGATLFEVRKLVTGDTGVPVSVGPLLVGLVASFVAGMLAIRVLLRYLQSHSLTVFVVYRLVLAAFIALLVWLGH
jgi:undecaprenyl-diphosphatase